MKIICLCILFFAILSCRDEQSLSKELSVLQSSSIILPQGEDLIIHNMDSMTYNKENKLKYIIYSDSLACSSCMINSLISWNPFIEYSKNYNGNFGITFLVPYNKDFGRITRFLGNDLATVLFAAFCYELRSNNSL